MVPIKVRHRFRREVAGVLPTRTAVMRLVALVRPGRGWVIGVLTVAACLLVAGQYRRQVNVVVQMYPRRGERHGVRHYRDDPGGPIGTSQATMSRCPLSRRKIRGPAPSSRPVALPS